MKKELEKEENIGGSGSYPLQAFSPIVEKNTSHLFSIFINNSHFEAVVKGIEDRLKKLESAENLRNDHFRNFMDRLVFALLGGLVATVVFLAKPFIV